MNAEQVKDEIRKLNRTDKMEVYRWIDEEMASDFISRSAVPGKQREDPGFSLSGEVAYPF